MASQVIYVLKSCWQGGGVKVVLEHVSRLRARGHDAKVFYLTHPPDWFERSVPAYQFGRVKDLTDALRAASGIKVATWFETAFWVSECVNPGDAGYYLVQDIEDSYAVRPEHKEFILSTYRLGLKPITEGKWVEQELLNRFGLKSVNVGIGLDFNTFQPVQHVNKDPFCVLTQCRVWTAGPEYLKGWSVGRRAVESAYLQDKRIRLMSFGIEDAQQVRFGLPYQHLQKPDDDHLNELYNHAALFLMSSGHEGFGLTAAEAMAAGTPVVCTRAQGNEEYCVHGETAMMANVGDHETLAKHIRFLIDNPDRAAEMAAKAKEVIKRYNWDDVTDKLEREYFSVAPNRVHVAAVPKKVTAPDLEYPDMGHLASASAGGEVATIIIPTVNDFEKVQVCVESIRSTTRKGEAKIIVVDDGTKDERVQNRLIKLSNEYDFNLLFNGQNLGFSASVNSGMLYTTSGKYMILCNNDIKFTGPWLDRMVGAGDADPDIAVIGCKLLYPDGTVQHAGVDKLPNTLHIGHIGRHLPADHPDVMTSKTVWAITGAVFAIKREALVNLGGFSTAYCTAWEDIDYCYHAWNKGWKVWYCADAEASHTEGGTRGTKYHEKVGKPLMWLHRDKAGWMYMSQKWGRAAFASKPEELNSKHITGTLT